MKKEKEKLIVEYVPAKPRPVESEILSPIDAADFLRIEGPTRRSRLKKIWWLCSKRRLPHYRSSDGKKIFFKRSELETYALGTRIRTKTEIRGEAENFVAIR